ncbi:MFS efflux transporter aclA [Physcia stellaris]|nr:MFS efflux transporter aclA [Physcia stellaris]
MGQSNKQQGAPAGIENEPDYPNTNTPAVPAGTAAEEDPAPIADKHSWRFWLIYLSMCIVSFASAFDSTIITTALPTISRAINGQEQYIWIANSFVLASTVVQPLVGQLSNIFGRRMPMIISVALFALGSGIAGGSNSVGMMITGRTIQGLGSGGIFVLVDLITCDLVSVRERGKYLGLMLSTAAIGTTFGPLAGGGLAQTSWRWVFYINVPISGTALAALVLFLRVKHRPETTWKKALLRVDYVGNILFAASICAILLALIMGNTVHPWSSWRTILPLVLGFIGWAAFHVYQASDFCEEPSVPPHLFSNRTSVVGFVLAFNSALLLEWVVYFLPLYFQSVQGISPLDSGIQILPLNILLAPFAIVAGILLSKFGRYRPIHWVGFAFAAIGFGLLSRLDPGSSKVEWVCIQIPAALGLGFVMTTILPSIQASLPESDAATATSTFAFLRSFGFMWGITVPGIIFNARFDAIKYRIGDPTIRNMLGDGGAYGYASDDLLGSLSSQNYSEVVDVYAKALTAVWEAGVAFALVGFLVVFAAKDVELRTELNTEFGLDEGKVEKDIPAVETPREKPDQSASDMNLESH